MTLNVLQHGGLLTETVQTGGDFCGRVVDLATEAANTALISSFNAAQYIGLQSATLLYDEFALAADTACTVAFRGIQQLLNEDVASQNSSSTIDLTAAAAAEDSHGTALGSPVVQLRDMRVVPLHAAHVLGHSCRNGRSAHHLKEDVSWGC